MSTLITTTVQGVQNIKYDASTTAMTIDSSGRVLQPLIPAFRVGLTSNQSITSTGDNTIEWNEGTASESDNCFTQGGFSWSSGVVTVPVTGVYSFNLIARLDNVGSGYLIAKIIKNNETSGNLKSYVIDGDPPTDYTNLTGSDVFKLTASDTIKVNIAASADSSYQVATDSSFSGHLVG